MPAVAVSLQDGVSMLLHKNAVLSYEDKMRLITAA